jgi:threonine/homoserine/homoserine lactone efflux protein
MRSTPRGLPVPIDSVASDGQALRAFAPPGRSRAFNAHPVIERWMRRVTAVVFIIVGGYYCLVYLFGL